MTLLKLPAGGLSTIILATTIGFVPAAADQLRPPAIEFEQARYQTLNFKDGTTIRHMEIEVRRIGENPSHPLQEVITSMYDRRTTSVFRGILKMNPGCSGLHMTWEKATRDGDAVLKEEISLDPREGIFPQETYPLFSLPYVLRGLQTDNTRASEIMAAVPGGLMMGFKVKKRGTTMVKVPAGEFRCWKVSLAPDIRPLLGFSMPLANQVLGPFLPKVHLWFDIEHPYALVKQVSIASIPPDDIKSVDQLVKITHTANDD